TRVVLRERVRTEPNPFGDEPKFRGAVCVLADDQGERFLVQRGARRDRGGLPEARAGKAPFRPYTDQDHARSLEPPERRKIQNLMGSPAEADLRGVLRERTFERRVDCGERRLFLECAVVHEKGKSVRRCLEEIARSEIDIYSHDLGPKVTRKTRGR